MPSYRILVLTCSLLVSVPSFVSLMLTELVPLKKNPHKPGILFLYFTIFPCIHKCLNYKAFGNVYIKPFKCTIYNYYNVRVLNSKGYPHGNGKSNTGQNNLKKQKGKKNTFFLVFRSNRFWSVHICLLGLKSPR